MSAIDRWGDVARRALEASQRPGSAQPAEVRAVELARAFLQALAEENPDAPRETAQVMAGFLRLPMEVRPAFLVQAASGIGAQAVDVAAASDTVRACLIRSFPEGSERRLKLGEALVRLGGGEPKILARSALEEKTARAIAVFIASPPARPRLESEQDVMERSWTPGRFGESRAPGAAPPLPEAATRLATAAPALPSEAQPFHAGPLAPAPMAGPAPGADDSIDRAALIQAFGQPTPSSLARPPSAGVEAPGPALARRPARPSVERLSWDRVAPGLVRPGTGRVVSYLGGIATRVASAREALWSHQDPNARVRYGVEVAGDRLAWIAKKLESAHEITASRLATAEPGFLESLDQARGELHAIRSEAQAARGDLQDIVGMARHRGLRAAVGELSQVEKEAFLADRQLHHLSGQAEVLESSAEPAFAAAPPQGEAAPTEEVSALSPDFTQADLELLGSKLDPARPPPQTLWNENMVNTLSSEGRKQGGITEEEGGRNAELARTVLNPEGKTGGARLDLTPVDLAAVLKASGVSLETTDPNQVVAATRYLNTATSLPEQADKLRRVLDNFQTLAKIGLPRLPREQLMGQLHEQAKVDGKASSRLSDSDLQGKFQEIAGTLNGGGHLETKIGDYTLKLSVTAEGEVKKSTCKKPGFWSRVGSAVMKVAPIALTALSFFPATAPFARIAQGAISLVKSIRAGSVLGAVTAVAGAVAGGASKFFKGIEGVANAAAGTLQGISSLKQGNILGGLAGIGAGLAGGIKSFAGNISSRLENVANVMGNVSNRLQQAGAGIQAARSYQQASRGVDEARRALQAARSSGDPRLVADAEKRLKEAERAKKGALFTGLGTGVMLAADSFGKRETTKPGESLNRPAAFGMEAGLRAASRTLNVAGALATRDYEAAGVNALGAFAAAKSGFRPREAPKSAEQEKVDKLLGQAPRISTVNDASNLADAILGRRQSDRAEKQSNAVVKDAQRALERAQLGGNPELISQAEAALKQARRGAEGALMGGIGAADALLTTASGISAQRRVAAGRDRAVKLLTDASQLAADLASAKDLSPYATDQQHAEDLRIGLTFYAKRYEEALLRTGGDPDLIKKVNDSFGTILGQISGQVPQVRLAASAGSQPGLRTDATPERRPGSQAPALSSRENRDRLKRILANDRATLQEDADTVAILTMEGRGKSPETAEQVRAREAYERSVAATTAVVLDDKSNDADIAAAVASKNLALVAYREARRPRSTDPTSMPPTLAFVQGFLEEAGPRALAVLSLGGSAGIERAIAEGRIKVTGNYLDDAAAVLGAYLRGVTNGVTFGGSEAFVGLLDKGLDEALKAGFTQFGKSLLGVEQIRVLSDPRRNAWEKAEAASSLIATWAGLAAIGVAPTRYRNTEIPNPFGRRPAAGPPPPINRTPGADLEGKLAPKSEPSFPEGISPAEGGRLTGSIRQSLGIEGRNVAVAEAHINGQNQMLTSVSGKASPPGTVATPSKPVFTTRSTGAITRAFDSEVKILEDLARRLSPSAKGTVSIFTERPACPSCRSVIRQFEQRFPAVKVIVTHKQ